MEYLEFSVLEIKNQCPLGESRINGQKVGNWKLETGITVNSGSHMLNDTSLLVFSVVPSSVIQQVCIHTPYSKMAANKLFFCLHVN